MTSSESSTVGIYLSLGRLPILRKIWLTRWLKPRAVMEIYETILTRAPQSDTSPDLNHGTKLRDTGIAEKFILESLPAHLQSLNIKIAVTEVEVDETEENDAHSQMAGWKLQTPPGYKTYERKYQAGGCRLVED
jgi:hypothetical protein